MNTNTQTPKLVQDRKTGEWYDPEQKMRELFEQSWFIDFLRRMADK